MRAVLLLALVPAAMWAAQCVALWRRGEPLRWSVGARDLPAQVKRILRIVTYAAFAGVVAAYPLARGVWPTAYYGRLLESAQAGVFWLGAGAAVLYLLLLYLAWLLSDNVRLERRHAGARLLRKLLAVVPTAVLVAAAEETLFRGVLLADLLETLHPAVALPCGSLIFAGAHYVREVKRYWTFPGHVLLGALFCVAFYRTGTLWLPAGLHAGGVVVLMAVRPFVRYTGPAWLVGASIFPYAGVAGGAALCCLILNIWHFAGGLR